MPAQRCGERRAAFVPACLLLFSLGCEREPGFLINIATWPDGVERVRVRTTVEGIAGREIYLSKDETRFVVRLPVGSVGTAQLDVDGLDATDCKLAMGSLTEPVPNNLNYFVERNLEFIDVRPPKCIFGDAANFAVGPVPYSLAVGDLDGDMKPDLAVANLTSNTVSILYGDGIGAFRPHTEIAAGRNPISVVIGDFDEDMKPDLAVANYINDFMGSKGSVSILLGKNRFLAATSFAVDPNASWVAVGYFDDDNKQDLAVVRSQNSIGIAFSKGQGSFITPTIPYLPTAVAVAVGDLNGDRRSDIAAATNTGVVVRLGNGQGLGAIIMPPPEGTEPRTSAVALGDFNDDKNLDIVSANYMTNNVSVLLGNGQGSFDAPAHFRADINPSSIAVGDFNGDMKLDLVVGNLMSGNVSVLLGKGQGKFGLPTHFPVGIYPRSVVVGDFNGDMKPDLAVANSLSGNVSILLNQF